MATILARYPLTASGRAQASGHLDRLGLGVEYLHEAGDELIALVPSYAGDEDMAKAHFAGATSVEHNALTGKVPQAGESEDWEPRIEIAGEIVERPASAREPQAPPEVQATPPGNVQDEHAPDTATTPSPGLSGAGMAQATADKANINAGQDVGPDEEEPAAPAKPAPKAHAGHAGDSHRGDGRAKK